MYCPEDLPDGSGVCAIAYIITRRGRFTTHMRFQAEAAPGGSIVAASDVFDGDYSGVHRHVTRHRAAHDQLIARLRDAGWRPGTGDPEPWYRVHFHRFEP